MPNLTPHKQVSFADIAHQVISFDQSDPTDRLILKLIDTKWVQRLRNLSQTGNTRLVYMFAEHSRFGHSLGVAYLASLLMKRLEKTSGEKIAEFRTAVTVAGLLHDIGHVAPGSHLGEKVWKCPEFETNSSHESLSQRVIIEDQEIFSLLKSFDPDLPHLVSRILAEDTGLPSWTTAIISGGGWNADRGNWAIVDSAMCCVSYGRYNVIALIDAFRLTEDGQLVLQESRLDALCHFYVARDSMYRQVYQHRVLQAADLLTVKIAQRARELAGKGDAQQVAENLKANQVYSDPAMCGALSASDFQAELALDQAFSMTESWWGYHLNHWTCSSDSVLSDLSSRLRDRRLFKTVRLMEDPNLCDRLTSRAKEIASELSLDPRYYVDTVGAGDLHRDRSEQVPLVLLDNGKLRPVDEVEPLIGQILAKNFEPRKWLVVPAEIKEQLGATR